LMWELFSGTDILKIAILTKTPALKDLLL